MASQLSAPRLSPLRLFFSVLVIVFVAEALVMLLLPVLLPHAAFPLVPLIDATVLVLLAAPLLWWIVARPLQAALAEKVAALATNVTLAREVDHRVKNNLQMLCDLLFLQSQTLASMEAKEALCDAYGRVLTIARLHEQLYQSMLRGEVRLGEYLGRLIGGLAALRPDVVITLDAPEPTLALDVDRAIHVGLIVNELVTNAMKHGFQQGQAGEVMVRLRTASDRVELRVRDTGRGLRSDLDQAAATTLGLRLVHILAVRLGATVTTKSEGGACFTLTFPLRADGITRPVAA